MCGSSEVPPPPPQDTSEQELNQMTSDMLRQSRAEQEALRPLLLSESGLAQTNPLDPAKAKQYRSEIVDLKQQLKDWNSASAEGTPEEKKHAIDYLTTNINDRERLLTPVYAKTAERLSAETRAKKLQEQVDLATERQLSLYTLQANRQEKALKGELPVSEGTQQRKMQEFQQLKEQLSRSGNPVIGDTPESAYSPTTAGTQSLKSFQDHYKLVEDAERTGELSQGSSALLGSLGLTSGISQNKTATMVATGSGAGSNTYNSLVGGPISLVAPTLSALQPYQFDRNMQFQTGMQNAANAAAEKAGYMQLAGSALGAAGAAYGGKSSRSFKKDIKALSEKDEEKIAMSLTGKRKIYKWKYKEEPDNSKGHIGVVTEEAPDFVLTDDKKHLDIVSYLGALTIGLRSMARKMDSLERRAA